MMNTIFRLASSPTIAAPIVAVSRKNHARTLTKLATAKSEYGGPSANRRSVTGCTCRTKFERRGLATKKQKRREESRLAKEDNFMKEQTKKKKRMDKLHPAAKWKRVISACQYWFSEANLIKDEFTRDVIRQYHGWMPISILLTFPKLQHWTDAEIVTGALQSALVKSKFRVTFSRDLCENPGKFNEIMGHEDSDLDFFTESLNGSSLNNSDGFDNFDDFELRDNFDDSQRFDESFDFDENDNVDKDSIDEENGVDFSKDILLRDDGTERYLGGDRADVEAEASNNEVNIGDDHNEQVVDLEKSNEESESPEAYEYDWGDVDDDEDELVQKLENKSTSIDIVNGISALPTAEEKKHINFLNVDRDPDEDLQYALVRHTKITLDYLDRLEKKIAEDETKRIMDDGSVDGEQASAAKPKPKKKKTPPLPKYKSNRQVIVVSNPEKLDSFCEKLLSSTDEYAKKCKDPESARTIGLDVEYCTLEMDIRGNLPAMIQMASPDPKGTVGLIWIDKFPNHGQDILKDPSCKSLRDIFEDPSLRKVGVLVTGDAKNLAQWFGSQNAFHIFSGLEDLEAGDKGAKLSEMSESVLRQRLPKIKELGKRKKKERKSKGLRVSTAHWRRTDLTPIMKQYAANDASCAVDIWLKRKEMAGVG